MLKAAKTVAARRAQNEVPADQSIFLPSDPPPSTQMAAEPWGAYTVDYLGCEHCGSIDRIKEIAAAGSMGPTEVIYLYPGKPPQEHSEGAAEIFEALWKNHRDELLARVAELEAELASRPPSPQMDATHYCGSCGSHIISGQCDCTKMQWPVLIGDEAPPPQRNLRALLDEAISVLDTYSDPASYNDGMGEMLEADAKDHPGLLAQATAARIRAALASTEGQDNG